MNSCPAAIANLVGHLDALSTRRSARHHLAVWANAEPILSTYATPASLAAGIRSARPAEQDALVAALVRVAAGDELAQLTVVAGLSRRLGWIVAAWRRAGVAPVELTALEADLVAECWIAVADLARRVRGGESPPPRPAMRVMQTAWQQVRGPRRRQRRRDARRDHSIRDLPAPAASPPAGEELAAMLVSAVKARRVSVTGARLVFTTRVAGLSVAETAERLGCSPQSVRTRRARAEHRLAAA